MLAQAVRRLLLAIPTLLAIVAAAFVLMHLAPGGPFTKERQMPPEIERRLQEKYGLDLPIGQQLVRYLVGSQESGGLLRGDLGPSIEPALQHRSDCRRGRLGPVSDPSDLPPMIPFGRRPSSAGQAYLVRPGDDAPSAAQAWDRTLAFFATHLG